MTVTPEGHAPATISGARTHRQDLIGDGGQHQGNLRRHLPCDCVPDLVVCQLHHNVVQPGELAVGDVQVNASKGSLQQQCCSMSEHKRPCEMVRVRARDDPQASRGQLST